MYDEAEVSASVLDINVPDVWPQAHRSEQVPAPESRGEFDCGQVILYARSLKGNLSMAYWRANIEDPEFDRVSDIHEICGPT